jgi:hypothetical protein
VDACLGFSCLMRNQSLALRFMLYGVRTSDWRESAVMRPIVFLATARKLAWQYSMYHPIDRVSGAHNIRFIALTNNSSGYPDTVIGLTA